MSAEVGAVVLAAGMSRRMGQPKLLLPWGSQTILSHILSILVNAEISPIVVVLGGFLEQTREIASKYPVTQVVNSDYANGEMISSLKLGLAKLNELNAESAFIVLGDQPMISRSVLNLVSNELIYSNQPIIIPSFNMKRGHPWVLRKDCWDAVIHLGDTQTLRDFLNQHQADICYLNVDDPDILKDIDTWDDYINLKPRDTLI